MTKDNALLETSFDFSSKSVEFLNRGKVRDIYKTNKGLLFVATDRLSAFDVIFNQGIENKGKILTHLSNFWTKRLSACQPYHLITMDVDEMGLIANDDAKERIRGRSMLVEQLAMLPVECVVRGYLVGSGWKDYQATGKVCGHKLPKGMKLGDKLPKPLFTPATKAEVGDHDENISFRHAVKLLGKEKAEEVRERSLTIYQEASEYAIGKGLVLVDTKFEFGQREDGTVVLADEVLTPDSSRYWSVDDMRITPAGQTPPSFDKQIVRNYLETLDWDKTPPPPILPKEILARTKARYEEIVLRLK